jgi:hypothetical protein
VKLLRILAVWGTAVAFMLGSPERGSLGVPRAEAATRLVCSSANFDYSYCRVDTRAGVRFLQQLSRAPCVQGRTWGTDPHGIWVDRGCSAQFAVESGSGGSAGAIMGAAIIGGIVGAILSGSGSGDRDRSPPPHYHHDYRYEDPSPPPYDRYGNPNYDRKGRYEGCHGLGCKVDNPDADDHSQDVDPTVRKFDKDGNPNYDADGNYIGGHGIGATVDNPDTPDSN